MNPQRALATACAVLCLAAACGPLDARQAKANLDASRSDVVSHDLIFAKRLADRLGGRPRVSAVEYENCSSEPDYGLEVSVEVAFKVRQHIDSADLEREIRAVGGTITDTDEPQGVYPEVFYVHFSGGAAGIMVKNNSVTLGTLGECIAVTREQANTLPVPR